MRKPANDLLMRGAFIPAMPLALNADREFNEYVQRRLIRYYLQLGKRLSAHPGLLRRA